MRILLSVLLLLTLLPSWTGGERLALLGRDMRMTATPIALDPADPAVRRIGQLTWLGGVQLKSPDPAFGGFSALAVRGDRFTLLSDGGGIVRFRLDQSGRIVALRFADLRPGPGTGWQKEDRDSESMTSDPRDGTIWIGFERVNAIWRYDASLTRAEGHAAPRAMARWGRNSGAESLVRRSDGSFVVFAEASAWPGRRARAAIAFAGDPTRWPDRGFRFSYVAPKGYKPTDAAELPDGRLLVLHRRFALPFLFSTKLTIVDPAAIRPGATVKGREIATLAPPLVHDNFEGVAVTRERGQTIVWIVSDDNQNLLQRTLLLKFRLEPDPPHAAAPRG